MNIYIYIYIHTHTYLFVLMYNHNHKYRYTIILRRGLQAVGHVPDDLDDIRLPEARVARLLDCYY